MFSATFEREMLIAASPQPFCDACRVLKHRGYSGPVEMWDNVRPYPLMISTIEYEASITFTEGDLGIRRAKWKPMNFVSGQLPNRREDTPGGEGAPTSETTAGDPTVQQEPPKGD